jgi:hypothetical protein
MVLGGRLSVEVFFDNIYEADGWLRREFRNFRKDVVLVFRFNSTEDLAKALAVFSHSFVLENKLFVPMGVVEEKFFLDEAYDLVEKVKEFGGIIVEARVTATNEAGNVKELDKLFNDVRREIELWNFSRAMDSLPKAKV